MLKIAINGFGRIGRCIARVYAEMQYHEKSMMQIVALNSNELVPETAAYMLKYDSVHGKMNNDVKVKNKCVDWGDGDVEILGCSDLKSLNWAKHNVDLVLECSGAFRTKDEVVQHIISGAKNVIVSAPCKNADATIVIGVNENILYDLNEVEGKVLSVGSCTTNCLAPVIKILHEEIGIESAFMTTVHACTNDQSILDSRHGDMRRGRAAAMSMIPTSTGAAKMIGEIIPSLNGKIDGIAVRVPVPNVSMIDLTFNASRMTSVDEINQIIKCYVSVIPSILYVSNEELVSVDFNHMPYSAIFDMTQTRVISDKLCRVVAWYDNEWGFAHRMLDLCKMMQCN